MKLTRRFAFFWLLAFSLVVALGDPPAGPAPLKVGVTPHFPPMVYKENGTLAGVEVDFAKALGKELNRPIQFVELDWEDQIPALADGRTDIIMSTMSITLARQLRVSFAQPYLTIAQTVLVRREDAGKYVFGFPIEPPGKVGVLKATTGDYLVQQEFPHAKRKAYDSAQEAGKALEKGRIDLLICDSPTAWWLAGMNEAQGLTVIPISLSTENLAWAVRKSDGTLLASVNAALAKFQANGTATAIIKQWIPLFQ
ncbi:MAG TPA: transporter substrate-binding domain-containing protein [Pseudomonadales bacterium]|nr:transporter substrate-binding domain-containing protein [Pseudomonadales bacterium]